MIDLYPNRIATLRLRAELSATELEVARLVACNLPNRDIAGCLLRSEHTVKTHIRRLLRKTGTTRRSQLVIWLYETGRLLPAHSESPPQASPPEPPPPPATRGAAAQHLHRTLSAACQDLDAALTHLGTL